MIPKPAAGKVVCYSGHTYPTEPCAVVLHGKDHPVTGVIARWRTPAGPAFRVRTAEGILFDLAYDETHDAWTVKHVESPT